MPGTGRGSELNELQTKTRDINARPPDTERVWQGCVIAVRAFERVAQPTLTEDEGGPALRFGDPPVMALLSALCLSLTALGSTHRSLRARVNNLLGTGYRTNQMSYDLARMRRNGLTERRPHSNTYTNTEAGQTQAPSSTPRSTTGSCNRSLPPTKPQHHYASSWPPSTAVSTATSRTPGSKTLPGNSRQTSTI